MKEENIYDSVNTVSYKKDSCLSFDGQLVRLWRMVFTIRVFEGNLASPPLQNRGMIFFAFSGLRGGGYKLFGIKGWGEKSSHSKILR